LPETAAKLYLYEVWESDRNGNPIRVNEVPLDTANGITLNYRLENGEWKEPEFLLRVVNHHDRELFCSMLYLSPSFGVSDEFLPTCLLPAGADTFPNDKKAVVVGVDEVLARAGVLESTFVLKLIYSTNEFSSSVYNQADLPFPQQDDFVTRSIRKKTPPADASDWATYELTITIVRPPDSVVLDANTPARLPGITIQPHSSLQAEVSLISTAQVTRDLEGKVAVVPPVFDEIANISAYKFTDGHAADPGLSVLEITGVSDRSLINHQQPLVMQLAEELADDEMIIPFASDGEFFFPVGGTVKLAGGAYEVCIEELPEPSPAGTRSLGGSVKILFQKLKYNLIGTTFEYPILAQAVFNGDSEGSFHYNKSTASIRDTLSRPETKNILLYIHGIIGDTEDMTKSAILAKRNVGTQVKAIADHYDAVLTFDYENLNTKIEENAVLLRKRLEEIGLGEGHDKNLHIVAHSMGGLVSRWFIEREGGNAIVNHLIMLGTPNAGSPISNVKEWATMAISALLGKISLAVWGVSPLVYLFNKAMTVAGVALAQLKPDSDFLYLLNQSGAPGIPYSVISGNINQIQRDAMNRLFLKLENVKDRGLEFLFRADNDIAVSVPSIQYVPTNPNTHYIEVACDHMSYFSSPEGLAALSEVIFERVDFK
jgi:pimeloyl-ACP methyl ester carboxylesterase